MLSREEFIEQAYFFRVLVERAEQAMPMQEILSSIKEEVLATTDLPKAIDFLDIELKTEGAIAPAMARLSHYFTPFQTFVISEAENDRGRFDLKVGLEILRREAEYRATDPSPQGIFLYQFESICRNRLRYDPGLGATAEDPIFDQPWRDWILTVRRQIGLIDLADLIYVRSQFYLDRRKREGKGDDPEAPILFGVKEGRIALANRKKDPMLLFSALQRQLNYPAAPRPKLAETSREFIDQVARRLERLEQRMKLIEEELKGGIQIDRYFSKKSQPDDST